MNSNMVKREKSGHLHLVYHFTIPLMKAAFFWKTMLVAIYAKILHCGFIPTIYENFKSVSSVT